MNRSLFSLFARVLGCTLLCMAGIFGNLPAQEGVVRREDKTRKATIEALPISALPKGKKGETISDITKSQAITLQRPAHLSQQSLTMRNLAHENDNFFPTQSAANWQTIVSEGFGTSFPNGWQLFYEPTVPYFWDDVAANPHSGARSGWCVGGAVPPNPVPDPNTGEYVNNVSSWMVYGPFDLSDATDAKLDFWYWLESETNFDHFIWAASLNGTNYYGFSQSGSSNGYVSASFDLKTVPTLGDLTGQPAVYIAFVFQSDGSITGRGVFLDDIVLQKFVGAATPADLVADQVYLRTEAAGGGTIVTNPQAGQQYYPHFDYSNTGGTAANNFTLELRLNNVVYCSGAVSLNANSTGGVFCNPITWPTGTNMLQGNLDVTNIIAESDENNNSTSQTYSGGPATPDINVTPASLTIQQTSVNLTNTLQDEFALRLQSRQFVPNPAESITLAEVTGNARRHVLLQFTALPALADLAQHDIRPLNYLHNNALVANVPANFQARSMAAIRWMGQLLPSDKYSDAVSAQLQQLSASSTRTIWLEAFHDVTARELEEMIVNAGGRFQAHPSLPDYIRLVTGTSAVFARLAENEKIAWLAAVNDRLLNLEPVYFCPGAMTPYGPVANFAAHHVGWDGPGLGSAALTYHFDNGTPDIAGTAEEPEVERGITEWSKYVQITFTRSTSTGLNRSIDIKWASGDHGDGSPFDGVNGVLAHAFFPASPNPETIAGDMHFDEAETWSLTSNIHQFTVALHEAGHSIGLEHLSDPNAVMFASYNGPVTGLHTSDIAAIQTLYASVAGGANSFSIQNLGNGTLTVNSISSNRNFLTATGYPSTPFNLAPNASQSVTVNVDWSLVGTTTQTGTIAVTSNDPDEASVGVLVTAIPLQNQPSITVTAPAAGATWTVGSSQTVTWTSSNITGNVNIKLSTDGGATFPITLVSNTANDGSQSITVPNNPASTCRVRVESVSNTSVFGMNPGNFTIQTQTTPSITVTAPAAGASWTVGSAQTVTWTSSNVTGNVNIKLSTDGGTTFPITLVSNTANDGSESISVPNNPSTTCRVRVESVSNPSVRGDNPGNFTIQAQPTPSITVTAPAAGVNWTVGSSQNVIWTSSNVTGNVNIKLSTDGGATFPLTLASNTANDGSQSITVPNNPSSTCRVRVESVSNTSVFGNNPGNFTIATSSTCTPTNCTGPAIFPVAQGATVFGQTIKAKDGQTVCIDIRLKENSQPIDAFGFKLQVDPSQLTFVSVEKGDLTTNFITVNAQENPAGSGNFTCGGFNTTAIPANSAGVLMRLCFTVKCNTVMASEIVLSAPTDDLVGFATCCNRFECVTCVRDGDLNGDGTLTPGDALCAFQIFLNNGGVPASCDVAGFDCEAVASDVNCDNTTTPGDALAIFSRFLQNQPPLECFARTASAQARLPYQLALVSRTVVSSANHQTLVKVALRVANPQQLRAFGLQLHYPAEQLELLGVTRAALTQDWMQLEGRAHEAGIVRIGGFNDKPITTNAAGELIEVVFASTVPTPPLTDFALTSMVDGFAHAQVENGSTSVKEQTSTPNAFKLHQSYPNPFKHGAQGSEMIIRFDLPGAASMRVELAIYNLAGQLVRQLVSGENRPGAYEITWDGKDERGQLAPSGTYLYRLKAGSFSESKQLTFVR